MKMKWIALLLALVLTLTAGCAMADSKHADGVVSLKAILDGEIDPVGKTIKACLCGNELEVPEVSEMRLYDGDVFELYDCKGTGTLKTPIVCGSGSRFEMHGGTIAGAVYGVANAGGKVTVSGDANVFGLLFGIVSVPDAENGKIIVKGGHIGGGFAGLFALGGEVTVSGGVIEDRGITGSLIGLPDGGFGIAAADNVKVKISKGEFKGATAAAARMTTDNSGFVPLPFSEDVIAEGSYLAEGSFDSTRMVVDYLPSTSLPQTGDRSGLAVWMLLAGMAGAGVFLLRRRVHI